MSPKNLRIFLQFKERSKIGEYGPIEIENDIKKGYFSKAIEKINIFTLISEYSAGRFEQFFS